MLEEQMKQGMLIYVFQLALARGAVRSHRKCKSTKNIYSLD